MNLPPRNFAVAGILMLGMSPLLSAATLTGTVRNGTTGKPAGGDEVVLLQLGEGMQEAGRTKTDLKGNFSFNVGDDGGPHLVRAIHQGVTYHKMAPPGTTSADIDVFDVSKKVADISVTADVMRFQAQGNELQGIRLFAVSNDSKPPRTQMNDANFEFFLPDNAEVDQGIAMTAGGQPITSAPVPQHQKNRYAFVFPLRPGTTQFQVVYHLPYSGQLSVDPKALYPAQHFVVMLPKTMQFSGAPGTAFKSMQDPKQSDAVVQVVSNTQATDPLAFSISGTGTLPDESAGGQQSAQSGGGGMGNSDNRPGGGLGPPIDAPDPLEKYRWYILGGFALVLAAGAVYIAKRPQPAGAADYDAPTPETRETRTAARTIAVPSSESAPSPNKLLDALKDEIFQLEMEHKQGKITQAEYDKAKAALDQTLERALKRASRA